MATGINIRFIKFSNAAEKRALSALFAVLFNAYCQESALEYHLIWRIYREKIAVIQASAGSFDNRLTKAKMIYL